MKGGFLATVAALGGQPLGTLFTKEWSVRFSGGGGGSSPYIENVRNIRSMAGLHALTSIVCGMGWEVTSLPPGLFSRFSSRLEQKAHVSCSSNVTYLHRHNQDTALANQRV